MFQRPRKDQIPVTATPPINAEGDSPDQRVLRHLVSFVLTSFQWVRSTPIATKPLSEEWLDRWDDEEYTYLETRIPGGSSDLELDLHIHDGVIFARIRRHCADAAAEAPHLKVDLIGKPSGVGV